jgi:hypothetical protein
MDTDKILEILAYTIPSMVTGAVAFYFFSKHINHEENRRRFYLHKENQKQSFPLRLQAYERMVLFLERINPNQLLIRVSPKSEDTNSYLHLLINSIEQEFEHNVAQQIYVSDECWTMIVTAKNATLQQLRNKAASTNVTTAQELQESVLKEGINEAHPSTAALAFIKTEVADLF